MIEIWTDGSGTTSGPIGWAWVAVENGNVLARGTGNSPQGTNNIAEMMGVIDGLKWAKENKPDHIVTVFTDSAYISNCFRDKWYEGWAKRKWKNARGRPVANKEYWLKMIDLSKCVCPDYEHVPGHTGLEYNELADELANQARKEIT